MDKLNWKQKYKPSLSNGYYGSYCYDIWFEYYPKTLHNVLGDETEQKTVMNAVNFTLSHIPFDLNAYYPYIKNYTFKTIFMDIAPSIAKSITLFYEKRFIKNTYNNNYN
eukprot:9791_1